MQHLVQKSVVRSLHRFYAQRIEVQDVARFVQMRIRRAQFFHPRNLQAFPTRGVEDGNEPNKYGATNVG